MRPFLQGNVVALLLGISLDAGHAGNKATTVRAFVAMMLAIAATDWGRP